jgi:hypothetical protein
MVLTSAAGGLVVQVAEGQAEEDGEDEDLQDFVAGHGFDDALREDVGDEVLEVQRAGLQVEAGGRFRQRHAEGGARLQQVGEEQADEQRAERGADEPAERLGTDAADRLRVAHVGQAGDQRGEDQRGDDHLDQAQEDVGQDAEVAGDFLGRGRRRRQRMAGIADDDAEDHGDADQVVRRFIFMRVSLSCKVGSAWLRRRRADCSAALDGLFLCTGRASRHGLYKSLF